MATVLLLATQRSGTQALGWLLNQHPDIRYFSEVFLETNTSQGNFWDYMTRCASRQVDIIRPSMREQAFAEYRRHLDMIAAKRHVLIDVKYNQSHMLDGPVRGLISSPILFRIARDNDLPVIHLVRRNMLKTFLSMRHSQQAKRASIRVTEPAAAEVFRIVVDIPELLHFLEQTQADIAWATRLVDRCRQRVTLEYETLFDRQSGCLAADGARKIEDLLGVTDLTRQVPVQRKMTNDHLEDVISNFHAVYSALRHTEHHWMLAG